jgi:N-methylhydantoinase A
MLGMLGPGKLAGGIQLDGDKARAALGPLSHALQVSIHDVARGVITIAASSMADAIREVTVEQGQDLRRTRLIPYGGAGPLFAALLARELNVRESVVPLNPGIFSAWGLLGADITRTASRTRILPLDEEGLEYANRILAELFSDVESRSPTDAHGAEAREVGIDLRYIGQEHSLTIAIKADAGRVDSEPHVLKQQFEIAYEQTFSHTMDEEIEIVSLTATLRSILPRPMARHIRDPGSSDDPDLRPLRAYSFAQNDWCRFEVWERSRLMAHAKITGPALILEETSTTYLDAGLEAFVHPSGCLFLSDRK